MMEHCDTSVTEKISLPIIESPSNVDKSIVDSAEKSVNNQPLQSKICSKFQTVEETGDLPEKQQDIDLQEFIKYYNDDNDKIQSCKRILSIIQKSTSNDFLSELRKCNHFIQTMKFLKYSSNDNNDLHFCKALLLCVISQYRLDIDEARYVEVMLVEFLKNVDLASVTINLALDGKKDSFLCMLPNDLVNKCTPVCEKVISSNDLLDVANLNITFLCLKALRNIAALASEWDESDFFSCSTVYLVLDKFQNLVTSPSFNASYNLSATDGSYDFLMALMQQCLKIFETVVFQNPRKQKSLLSYRENLFLKCICRNLSFCLRALFANGSCDVKSADDIDFEKKTTVVCKYVYLHQSCLISTLKVLLNVHPNYDSDMYEITSSLMEKLLICFLETSYSTLDCKFELCLMALELMVNLTEFELIDRKQFAKMCLMKFKIGKCTYLSVEILIKVLIFSLKRVITLGSLREKTSEDVQDSKNSTNDSFNAVFHVAEEHMEHSFICSYICVFLSYFCEIKEPFFVYVLERISVDMAETAIIVMGKFKEFLPLMGKQNGHAFNMLDRAIRIFLGMTKSRE